MKSSRNFAYITFAYLVGRASRQIGKTPLLPIFAASPGATGAFLRFIVSVPALTGMVLKPVIGIFSDRWGRRSWLIIGTLFLRGLPLGHWLGYISVRFALPLLTLPKGGFGLLLLSILMGTGQALPVNGSLCVRPN